MHIVLNGKTTPITSAMSIAALVEHLGLGGKRIAVEINENIVPRSTHATTVLQDGDRVEIVHAIGGG